jgi:hypothetical protein
MIRVIGGWVERSEDPTHQEHERALLRLRFA